jgi:hypothetical protein
VGDFVDFVGELVGDHVCGNGVGPMLGENVRLVGATVGTLVDVLSGDIEGD